MDEIVYVPSEFDRKMWKVYLELWQEFDRVARKHNLKYFLFNGTLIGAVRHKGFIPWDDDFDIAMSRKDYDRLQYELSKEFNEPFFFQSILSDPTHFNGLNRLRKSDTTMILRYDYNHPCNNGVYIDIYPIDNLPDDPVAYRKINQKAQIFRHLFYYHVYGSLTPLKNQKTRLTLKQYGVKTLSKVIFSLYDEKRVYRYFQKQLGAYQDVPCKYAASISVHPFRKANIWHTEDISDIDFLEFEGHQMPVPKGWNRCLMIRYGNYMEIPPAEAQKPIHCTKAYMNPDIPYTKINWNPFESWK